jgi:hypothetical protein
MKTTMKTMCSFKTNYSPLSSRIDEIIQTSKAIAKHEEIFPYHHKVEFTKTSQEAFLEENGVLARDLLIELNRSGFEVEFYHLKYELRKPNEINLAFIKTPRHALAFYTEDDFTVRLEMLYRHCERDENRQHKASDLLGAFAAACKAAEATTITLDCQPFGLHPRLPYRENLEHLDPELEYLLPDREDLVKFYQKLGYQFLEERDEMMVQFLGINPPS